MKRDAKFEDLFQAGLETLYDAEGQIVAALPKMVTASSSEELAEAFTAHLEETRQQIARLETIFQQLGEEPRGKESEGLRGLLSDAATLIGDIRKSPALDVALVAAARKVEHWEMVAYESLCDLAEILGQEGAVDLLQGSLDEEADADLKLADVADSILNGDAEVRKHA